jgi:hypothetical protein
MSQRKHYGHFLPEAGRAIEYYANKIVSLQKELEEKQTLINDYENEIVISVKGHWDEKEIALAKEIAHTHNSKL